MALDWSFHCDIIHTLLNWLGFFKVIKHRQHILNRIIHNFNSVLNILLQCQLIQAIQSFYLYTFSFMGAAYGMLFSVKVDTKHREGSMSSLTQIMCSRHIPNF